MKTIQSRRRFLATLSSAGAAGLIGAPSSSAQDGRLETTTVRLAKIPGICVAPQYVAEELLKSEGFTDVQYVELTENVYPGFVAGKITDTSRPPWNYRLVAAGVLLALVPTAGIVAGVFDGLRNRCLRFGVVCLGIYIVALLNLYLVLPVYSTAKATYLLGLTPVLGLLFAAGAGPALRRRGLRAVVYGLVVAWAASSYGSFFIT